jgi:hypothetical protein
VEGSLVNITVGEIEGKLLETIVSLLDGGTVGICECDLLRSVVGNSVG